jgi:hypothetical protein
VRLVGSNDVSSQLQHTLTLLTLHATAGAAAATAAAAADEAVSHREL